MVGSNYTDELQSGAAWRRRASCFKLWDYNLGVGGPIVRDRIWFFGNFRDEGSHRTVPGMFANRTPATRRSGPT